jgi:hypothetical protein
VKLDHDYQMTRSDFLKDEVTATDISGWAELLPNRHRLIGASLFADLFIMDGDGAIHMLEVSAASIRKIAGSKDEFRERCINDEGWLLRPPLIDAYRWAKFWRNIRGG